MIYRASLGLLGEGPPRAPSARDSVTTNLRGPLAKVRESCESSGSLWKTISLLCAQERLDHVAD